MKDYLANYAEASAGRCAESLNRKGSNWDFGLVVPIRKERTHFQKFFDSVANAARSANSVVLCTLVVNQSKNTSEDIREENRWLLEKLSRDFLCHHEFENTKLLKINSNLELLLVDFSSAGNEFPEKRGVGLARKWGADLCTFLFSQDQLQSPWIRTSDADVILPSPYFQNPKIPEAVTAFVYAHEHLLNELSELEAEALQVYDQFLRHHVHSLTKAGSPYAYQSIGSLLSFHAASYAKVRGFPKDRLAGEDFYLLNKLAKLGPVVSLQSPVIKIRGRLSDRIPFGTGPSIKKILNGDLAIFYAPEIYDCVQLVYAHLNSYESSAKLCSFGALAKALEALDFFAAMEKIARNHPQPSKFKEQAKVWFDAFRCLKFMNFLRDHQYPSITLHEALFRPGPCIEEKVC